ncbi:YnbE family lipoprotein [Marivibrio halodurans]|uniref:YnbE family lipoprotein n=1 Tax=Marivibrio halodurans TaxID=2039722 RepID=A0A8J7RYD1_9PROT|nr:YnbE family lipoprotein [Marivibrio halodurans]MBP5855388.1 YnbE family lipoprotein [Marivibrio halodurans]
MHIAPTEPRARRGVLIPALLATVFLAATLLGLGACTPTVAVQAPKEPITINLNVKLDADVRLRVEEKAEKDVQNNPIF